MSPWIILGAIVGGATSIVGGALLLFAVKTAITAVKEAWTKRHASANKPYIPEGLLEPLGK